ncbi:hypothetical protein Bca4012_061173 [Brassica carinata]
MTANALTADAGLIITSIGCFSGESWKTSFNDSTPFNHKTTSRLASIDKAFFVRGFHPQLADQIRASKPLSCLRNIYPDKSYFAIIVHVFPPLAYLPSPTITSASLQGLLASQSPTASTLPPFPLPMERDDSSALLPSDCFRLLIGLLSCGAVSTGPEDAIENTSVFLVDEVWISTSYYVTILQLTDFVVKAPPTHSSIVSNHCHLRMKTYLV